MGTCEERVLDNLAKKDEFRVGHQKLNEQKRNESDQNPPAT